MQAIINLLESGLNLTPTLAFIIGTTVFSLVIFLFLALFVLLAVWLERKVSAVMQDRWGPMRAGLTMQGEFQTIADTVKLLMKEDIIPSRVDKFLYIVAPFIVFIASFMAAVVLPFGPAGIASDMALGAFYILAVSSLGVIGIVMAGWSSNNKWSLYGAIRAVAQIVSYEIPIALLVIAIVMYTGSFSISDIVAAQDTGNGILGWFFLRNPFLFVGMIIFIIAGTAENNRNPFDLPEGESELVAGFHTEYTGMRFAFFFLAEYVNMFIMGMLIAVLFFGGYTPIIYVESLSELPVLSIFFGNSFFWIFMKALGVVILQMWFRWTFPRVRVDQLMYICWKVLIPFSMAIIVLNGFWMKLFNLV